MAIIGPLTALSNLTVLKTRPRFWAKTWGILIETEHGFGPLFATFRPLFATFLLLFGVYFRVLFLENIGF